MDGGIRFILAVVLGAFFVTGVAEATDFTDWLGRRDWRATEKPGVVVDRYGRRLVIRSGTRAALRRELTAQLLLEALGAANIPFYPALASEGQSTPMPVGDDALAENVRPVLVRAVPSPADVAATSRRLLERGSSGLATIGLVRFVLGSGRAATEGVTFVKGFPVAGAIDDLFATFSMRRSDAFAAVFRSVPLTTDERGLAEVADALARLEALDEEDWKALLGPDAPTHIEEVRARVRAARQFLLEPYPRPVRRKLAAKREDSTRPLVRLPNVISLPKHDPPARQALWAAWHGALPGTTPVAPLQSAVIHDGRGSYHVLSHQAIQWQQLERDESPQLAATANARTLVVGSGRDGEGFAILRLAKASGARTLPLPGGHGSRLDGAVRDFILDEYARAPFDRLVLVEHPPEEVSVELALANDPRFEYLSVDHHRYTARKMDRQHARSSLEQVAEILGAKLSPSYHATALRDRGSVQALLDGGFDRRAIEAEFELPMAEARALDPVETPKGRWYVLGNGTRNNRDLGNAIIALSWPSVPNVIDVREGVFYVRSTETVIRRFGALADLDVFSGIRIYEFGQRDRCKVLAMNPIGLTSDAKLRLQLEKVLEEVGGKALVSAFRERLSIATPPPAALDALTIASPLARAAAIGDSSWALLTDRDRALYLETATSLTLGGWMAQIALRGLFSNRHAPAFVESDMRAFVRLADKSEDPRWLPFLRFVQQRRAAGAAYETNQRAKAAEAKLLTSRCSTAIAN